MQRSDVSKCEFYQYSYSNSENKLGGWIIRFNEKFYIFDERLKNPVNEINIDIIKQDDKEYVLTLKHGRPIRTRVMRQCDIDYARKVLDRDLKEIEDAKKLESIEAEEKKRFAEEKKAFEEEKKAFEEQKKQLEAQILNKAEKSEVVSAAAQPTEKTQEQVQTEPEPQKTTEQKEIKDEAVKVEMKVENNNVNINVEKVEPKEQPEKIEPAPEKKE